MSCFVRYNNSALSIIYIIKTPVYVKIVMTIKKPLHLCKGLIFSIRYINYEPYTIDGWVVKPAKGLFTVLPDKNKPGSCSIPVKVIE